MLQLEARHALDRPCDTMYSFEAVIRSGINHNQKLSILLFHGFMNAIKQRKGRTAAQLFDHAKVSQWCLSSDERMVHYCQFVQ